MRLLVGLGHSTLVSSGFPCRGSGDLSLTNFFQVGRCAQGFHFLPVPHDDAEIEKGIVAFFGGHRFQWCVE